MKKLFFVALLGVASLMSASIIDNFNSNNTTMSKSLTIIKGQENENIEVLLFKQSAQYSTLKKTFNLKDEDFNFAMTKENNISENVISYMIPININGRKDIVSFTKLPNNNFVIIYNKINMNKKGTAGYSEFYDELKNFYLDYKVEKVEKGFEMTLNDVLTSRRLGISNPSLTSCIATTYKKMKDACDSSARCKLLCDATDLAGGQCTISMIASATYICATKNLVESGPAPELPTVPIDEGFPLQQLP